MNRLHIALMVSLISTLVFFPGTAIGSTYRSYGELEVLSGMVQPRYNHTATAFFERSETGGETCVVVAGGTVDGSTSISSSEILRNGLWGPLPSMNVPRMKHSAVEVRNKVFVSGGFIGTGHPSFYRHFNGTGNDSLSSCEIYEESTGEWTLTSPMKTGRFWHGMVVLGDNKVIVIGGLNTTSGALSSCEEYDPETDTWSDLPSLPIPLTRFAYGVSEDGNVIVAGGHDGIEKIAQDRVFILEKGAEEWKEVSSMLFPRGYPGYCFVDEDLFVVSGGFSSPGNPDRSDSEVYDMGTDTWRSYGSLMFPRHGHGSEYMADIGILIAGGSNCETGGCHSNMEFYDQEIGEWVETR